jgi:hypothetical protein
MTTNKDFIENDNEEINDHNIPCKSNYRKVYTYKEMKTRLKQYGCVYGRNSY